VLPALMASDLASTPGPALATSPQGCTAKDFDPQLTQYDDRGWRATFYTTGMEHSPTSATGPVICKLRPSARAQSTEDTAMRQTRVLHRDCLILSVLVVTFGCASPTPPHESPAAVAGLSTAESSASPAPRFAAGGPNAQEYGANEGYPVKAISRLRFLVGLYSHYDQLVESRTIRRAASPSRLLRAPTEPALRYEYHALTRSLDDYLAHNPATGLLIARGDTILVERYQYARTDRDRFTSFSMAKTVTAMLVGIAIAENLIRSVDDPAGAYVPALADTEYGHTSLRHLLQMSSGVRFREDYSSGEKDDVTRLFAETVLQGGPGGVEAVKPYNQRVFPSGMRFSYASVETQVLGLVVRSVVGRPMANRGRGRRHLDHRRLGAGGDLLLSQRGTARLRAACFAARARRAGRRPADHPKGVVARGHDHRRGRLTPQTSMATHGHQLWLSDLDLARRAPNVRPARRARPSHLRRSCEPTRHGAYGCARASRRSL